MHYKGYKELESYIKARELRIEISEIVKQFPTSEKFLLSNQIVRSSRSITAILLKVMAVLHILILEIFS